VFVFFIMTVAAAAIGHWLGHSGGAVRQRKSINVDQLDTMKGFDF